MFKIQNVGTRGRCRVLLAVLSAASDLVDRMQCTGENRGR